MTSVTQSKKEELLTKLDINYDVYSRTTDVQITPGWNSNNPNFTNLVPRGEGKVCIEVGSWTGGSAKTIAGLLRPSSCLICCDTFLGSVEHFVEKEIAVPRFEDGRPALFEMFIKNTEEHRDKILPMQTTSTVLYDILVHHDLFVDFVYIDGDHAADVVERDIIQYYSRLNPGGVLLGDDHNLEGVERGLKATGLKYVVNSGQFIINKPL
tara:strand:- start:146650 stop:147279 length:630 start_codon:yes stop_codon:yes gene_type:complete